MRKQLLLKGLLSAALVLGLSSFAFAQMALDLDTKRPGDDGVREGVFKPGDTVTIELVALKGAKGIIGFQIQVKLDPTQATFKGFKPAGLMAGAMPIINPLKDGAEISAALLGKTSSGDSGTLGHVMVELSKNLGPGTKVGLAKASYGTAEGTQEVDAGEPVKLINSAAPPGDKEVPDRPKDDQPVKPPKGKPGMPPMGKPGEMPEPPECGDELVESEMGPQAENVPCGPNVGDLIFRTVCSKEGYDKAAITLPEGRAAACFGVEAITRGKVAWGIRVEGGPDVYHAKMGPRPLEALVLADRRPSKDGKYTIYLDRRASDPDARVTVRFIDHPMDGGPGGPPPGKPPFGTPGMKPGMPPMGPPEGPPPDPKEVIGTLPKALQPSFLKTLEVGHRSGIAHMEAELEMLKSVRQTLEETKRYLPKASKGEKEAIAGALMFFEHMGPGGPEGPEGPGPSGPPHMGKPGGPRPGGPPMKGPRTGPPPPPEELVAQMIKDVDRDIEHISRKLEMMKQEMMKP